MSVFMKSNGMVTFSVKDRLFTLSEEEIMDVYDYQSSAFRAEDARRQLAFFAFGDEEPDEEQLDWFACEFGFLYSEFCEFFLDEIVDCFDKHFDCNADENSTWQNAVGEVLRAHKGGKI